MAESEVFMPIPTADAVRQLEILTLRQIGDTLKALTEELKEQGSTLSGVKEDVAVMKYQIQENEELKQDLKDLKLKFDDLNARNLKQDGAAAVLEFANKYGGWLAGLGGIAYGVLHH